jgi:hypothetical protein
MAQDLEERHKVEIELAEEIFGTHRLREVQVAGSEGIETVRKCGWCFTVWPCRKAAWAMDRTREHRSRSDGDDPPALGAGTCAGGDSRHRRPPPRGAPQPGPLRRPRYRSLPPARTGRRSTTMSDAESFSPLATVRCSTHPRRIRRAVMTPGSVGWTTSPPVASPMTRSRWRSRRSAWRRFQKAVFPAPHRDLSGRRRGSSGSP